MRARARRLVILGAILAAGLAAGPAGRGAAQSAYEPPATVRAGDLVPESRLQGPRYTIEEAVPTDGFLARVTIRSDFGTLEARGPGMVETRLGEVAALAALEEIKTTDAFASGVKESAQELGRDFEHLIDKPAETVQAIPAGVGRFFERTAQAAKRGAQKLGELKEEQKGTPPPAGPGARLPGVPEAGAPRPDVSVGAEAARLAGRTTVDILGYDDARRRLAKRVRVDPYTTNPVLAKRLNDVAWASFAGGVGLDLVKAQVPGSMAVSVTTTLSDWVWDTPPNDLRLANNNTLRALGVDQEAVDWFLRHRAYTLTLQTILVRALDRLAGVAGRPGVMALAVTVLSEEQARFVVGAVEMLARHHETVAPLAALEVRGTVVGRTKTGRLVVPGPVDYLSWTEGLARFARRADLGAKERELRLTGRASPRARQELVRLGWMVQEQAGGVAAPAPR
jgi:hypothetical protein